MPEVPADVLAKENPLRAISDELYAEYDAALGAVDFTAAAAVLTTDADDRSFIHE